MEKVGISARISMAAFMALVALPACGPPPPPVYATLQVPTLRVHGQPEVTKEGITVSLRPILADTVRGQSQIYKTVTYTVMRYPTNMFGQPITTEPKRAAQGKAELSIIPLPAFKVSIANHSGHVLKFTETVFRLQTGTGQNYQLFSGSNEIAEWLENIWVSMPSFGPDVAEQVMPGLRQKLAALPLLNRNTVLLNGDEWNGFLVFNLNTNSREEADEFLNSIDRLRIRLAEVPIQLDDAGQVSKTTEFAFVVDKSTAPLRVKCPPGTKNPSTAICTKER